MGMDGKRRKACFSCDLKYSRCGSGEPEGGGEGGMKSRECRCGRTKASVPRVTSESVTEPAPEEDRGCAGGTPAAIDLLTPRDSLCGLCHFGASLVLTGARKMGG